MKDTEILKAALEKAITERNIIILKDVAAECSIKHIKTNDLLVMCNNLVRKNPEYKLYRLIYKGQPEATASLFQTGALIRKGWEYEEINVADKHEDREEVMRVSGQRTVPVIDIDGEIIVGFDKKKIEEAMEE